MSLSFKDYFSRQASNYAKYRPGYPDELYSYLTETATAHTAAWDCATGNGQVAIGLAPYFEAIYATDASASQIANAFPHPRIRYSVAPAGASELPDRCVDLITVGLALHWLPLEEFYAEVKRVGRPRSLFAVWCSDLFQVADATPEIAALIEELYNLILPMQPPEVQLVHDHYQTVPFPFEELPAPTFRQSVQWTPEMILGCVSTWSAVQRYADVRGWDGLKAWGDRLSAAWGDPAIPLTVCWDIYLRVGRV
ncbi:MAG: class I SAM-dependent methyltransferase [Cyanobacteria bacterium J069]